MEALTLQYDNCYRLLYNPFFHPNHGKPWTEEDLEYLCRFIEHDGPASMAMALGRPASAVATKEYILRKKGLFYYYKNLNKHW